ncbi:hypothetical protein ACG02S_19320 [Roseateles sp. DC23W]|uniref:Lipoprotein SmpA/OmlA domain-containing protein n=1 Tax=Pelomonas dachongensis TaxID=3299029 RepID=A0ABW7ERB6_9BURK
MKFLQSVAIIGTSALLAACASSPSQPPVAPSPTAESVVSSSAAPRLVKSIDGKYTGEVKGVITRESRFSKLKIGMSTDDVQTVFGRAPDRSHSYESGKRWIPFYFGNDARRMQVLYKGEGCLIFTGGNVWGGGGGDLIQIEADPSGKCYEQ